MNDNYSIRNYHPKDLRKFTEFIAKEEIHLMERRLSPQIIGEHLNRPNYSPDEDLFIISKDSNLVGYLEITQEPDIKRMILDCWIHPEHRRRGLGKRLLSQAIIRASELGINKLHVSTLENNTLARKVLLKLGFKHIRKFNELRLEIPTLNLQQPVANEVICRPLQHGEEATLTELQNRCFFGSWGYHPNTVKAINYRVHSSSCSPQDIILFCQDGRPTSYCWTEITPKSSLHNKKVGRIYMIGVDPDHRGRGFGRMILTAGLIHLKSKGVELVELTVDSTNHVACALYEAIGFRKWATSLWYERQIQGTTAK